MDQPSGSRQSVLAGAVALFDERTRTLLSSCNPTEIARRVSSNPESREATASIRFRCRSACVDWEIELDNWHVSVALVEVVDGVVPERFSVWGLKRYSSAVDVRSYAVACGFTDPLAELLPIAKTRQQSKSARIRCESIQRLLPQIAESYLLKLSGF
jgi:hypothetical protein